MHQLRFQNGRRPHFDWATSSTRVLLFLERNKNKGKQNNKLNWSFNDSMNKHQRLVECNNILYISNKSDNNIKAI